MTAAVAIATAAVACGSTGSPAGVIQVDTVPPTVKVMPQPAPNDSSIAFAVQAADDLGLLNVHVRVSGPGIGGSIDTTFTSTVTSVTLPYVIGVPAGAPTGTGVTVIASAMDGAHNVARPDTALIATARGGAPVPIRTPAWDPVRFSSPPRDPVSGDSALASFVLD